MQGGFAVTHYGSKEYTLARAEFERLMCERLQKKPEIIQHILPDFPPGCKRLTPGPGYLEALTSAERSELLDLALYAQRLLRDVVKAQGFNIGFNLGSAAGAGVESHVHLHIVPRWVGDHNFMPILGRTRVISEGLQGLYDKLIAAVERTPWVSEGEK